MIILKLVLIFYVLLPLIRADNCGINEVCVRFCCAHSGCNITDFNITSIPGGSSIVSEYKILKGRPCSDLYELEPFDYASDEWTFIENGSIVMSEGNTVLDTNDYCLAKDDSDRWMVLSCFREGLDESIKFKLYPRLLLISVPFLLLTFIVYSIIDELRNFHGKILLCYVGSLATFFTLLALIQLRVIYYGFGCKLAGFCVYLAMHTSFFWLNVMSFDVWNTVKKLRTSINYEKRFKCYCLYAFGMPIIFTTILFIVDHAPIDFFEPYRANIGVFACSIGANRTAELIYIYVPLSVIMLINSVLFVMSSLRIYKLSKSQSTEGCTRLDVEKERQSMYLKLFIIMGLSWIFEVISWIFPQNFEWFYATDVLNCMQGFVVFIMFVMKRNVFRLIVRQYPRICGSSYEPNTEAETEDIIN